MGHVGRRTRLAAVLLCALLAAAGAPASRSASAQSGIALYDLGSQEVSGTDWSFAGDFAVAAGAWESVTVSNYGYCFVGPNDPRAGTAHAGGVFWFGELLAQPPQDNNYIFAGELRSGRDGGTTGRVRVTTSGDFSAPATHVDVSLSGSDLSFFEGNSLEVCLLGSS